MRRRSGFSLPVGEFAVRYGSDWMRKTLLVGVFSVVALLAACGGSDNGVVPGAPDGVSDEEYLEVLCTGSQRFAAALIAQSSPQVLRDTIGAYATEMKAVTPPRDVSQFHKDYINFLEEAEREPALMVGGNPPMPPEPARSRIASKENSVEACEDPVYFGQGADD